jgi:mono/diheme cytochrome c family protein
MKIYLLVLGLLGDFGLHLRAEQAENKALPAPAKGRVDFARDIEPIFAQSCYSCHGAKKQRSGYRLDQKTAALKGGDFGTAIVPGKSADSPLIRYVAGIDADVVMPPEGPRLTPAQVGLLRAWIDQGAPWPETASNTPGETTWWSLRPLQRPQVPEVKEASWLRRNALDAFVQAKLLEQKLTPAPEVDRRTLIRRLNYDLLGLPPAPEEVEAFVRDDAPHAYEALVERLLASPHYGERWARHWLDVVHYGETHGYDKDKPRLNAWPYRDYVIRAFNEDRPYRRFVEEQIAGDVLYPGTVDGIAALGFLSAGPWDFIGHAEVPETRIDGKITRHLDRDDMVANTIGTFNSMTVSCAQCHNHKFDSISMEDYYSLHAVFAALDRADRAMDSDPVVAARRTSLQQRERELEASAKKLDFQVNAKNTPELAELERKLSQAQHPGSPLRPEYGYHSAIERSQGKRKWVQVDLGSSRTFEQIVLTGCYDDFNQIGAGFGFPVRFKVELADDAEFQKDVRVAVDRTDADVVNPGTEPQVIKVAAQARYVRVTATQLAPRQNDFIFALAELSVLDPSGKNLALGAPVSALDSIEALPRWSKKNLVDGVANSGGEGTPELERLRKQRDEMRARLIDPATRQALAANEKALAEVRRALKSLPAAQMVYAGTVHHGSGAFAGTGAQGGKPRPIFILARGDVRKPGKEVGPGALSALPDLPARFDLGPEQREGERRAALARWLTDARNPLTWRSLVNRVWLYHFGRGLVDSPNDFGRMGQLPSHPELLDWLAAEFRDGSQSLKALQRLIVTSATYRQSSAERPEAARVDGDNQYYWRMNRRRLEAEAIRDSVLVAAGALNPRMGGPSFQDFVIKHPEHSPHYKYELHDPEDPRTHRRSIYRFIVRSQQQPFLATLDCADPSLAVEKRNQTITPQQALALLNNQLTLVMAKHFAERVRREEPDSERQPATAFRLALGRTATRAELEPLAQYARTHGLENLCRVVMNLNEFIFVD